MAIEPSVSLPGHARDLVAAALLDGDRAAVLEAPIDGRAGQRHEERHVVVARGERLEIGADLVGDVAGRGGAVGAHHAEIHALRLHEMAAGIVGDERMRHAMRARARRR